jgi:shikimate kinase
MEGNEPCTDTTHAAPTAPDPGGDNACDPGAPVPCTIEGSVFLVGMMGAGKTSVGRLLAQRLGKRFIDADQEIEARCGVSIPVIFEIEGEAGFRQRERQVIDELTMLPDIVLATGGGAVLSEESRVRLHQRGLVIYLKASAAEYRRNPCFGKPPAAASIAGMAESVRRPLRPRQPRAKRPGRPASKSPVDSRKTKYARPSA